MIIPVSSKLRNSECINFYKDVIKACSESASVLQLEAGLNGLAGALAPMDKQFIRKRSSKRTAQLAELDEKRDRMLTGLRTLALACSYHLDAAVQQAGQTVLACIDSYGKRIIDLNYPAETQVLGSMVNNMENIPSVRAAITLMHAEEWVQQLKVLNLAFGELYRERVFEYVAQPAFSTEELRATLASRYRSLCAVIIAHATLNTQPGWRALVDELNQFIVKYNLLVKKRRHDNTANQTLTEVPE